MDLAMVSFKGTPRFIPQTLGHSILSTSQIIPKDANCCGFAVRRQGK